MIKNRIVWLLSMLILMWIPSTVMSQKVVDESNQGEYIEDVIGSLEGDEDFDYNVLFDILLDKLQNPLHLNKASYDDLKDIKLLNDIQIEEILSHRSTSGEFISILELQSLPSMDMESIRMLLPFVTVNEDTRDYQYSIGEMLQNGRGTLYLKTRQVLEEQDGYISDSNGDTDYAGSPTRIYTRLQYAHTNKLKLGITAEKDAGEEWFRGSNKQGFDFYSAHFHLKDYNRTFKDIVIGDYSVSFGQGLILQNQFGGGKSAFTMNVKRGGRVLKSYGSINEYNFYRGAGATIYVSDRVQFTPFVSIKNVGGTLSEQDTSAIGEEFLAFSSIKEDGLHRTDNEIAKKNAIQQFSTGGNLTYRNGSAKIGLNVLYDSFNKAFDRSDQLYNKYRFRGTSLLNGSIDYSYIYQNLNLFGEVAMSDNGKMALLSGLLMSLDTKVDVSLMYRNYDRAYQSLASNSFGETTSTNNESGLYLGLAVRLNNNWSINAYGDIWKHEWLRFRRDAPSEGREYLVRFNYNKRRKRNFYLQYKYETKEINSSNPDLVIDQLVPLYLHRFRIHHTIQVNKEIELRQRFEYSYFEDDRPATTGFLVYQDIMYKPQNIRLKMSARLAYFNIEDFDNRIYTYERDLIYEFFIPFFQNQGWRYYLNLKYDWHRNFTTELRYSQTRYTNIDEIGSGNEQIIGNTRSEYKAQIRYRF